MLGQWAPGSDQAGQLGRIQAVLPEHEAVSSVRDAHHLDRPPVACAWAPFEPAKGAGDPTADGAEPDHAYAHRRGQTVPGAFRVFRGPLSCERPKPTTAIAIELISAIQ